MDSEMDANVGRRRKDSDAPSLNTGGTATKRHRKHENRNSFVDCCLLWLISLSVDGSSAVVEHTPHHTHIKTRSWQQTGSGAAHPSVIGKPHARSWRRNRLPRSGSAARNSGDCHVGHSRSSPVAAGRAFSLGFGRTRSWPSGPEGETARAVERQTT